MNQTDWTAIAGLVIASISLGWNILNELRKTPRAKVSASIGKMVQGGRVDPKNYLWVQISNIGSRPIKIKEISFTGYKLRSFFKRRYYVLIPKDLPIYLKDGEDHSEFYPYSKDDFKNLLDKDIQELYVTDSAGRQHKVPMKSMAKFKTEIKTHLKNE